MRGRPAAGLALLTLLCVGCAGFSLRPDRGACPVVPVATSALPQGLLLRSRVSLIGPERELRLEVVAEATPEELVVVGLAPFGMRLFAVHQRGQELSTETLSDREFGRAALWVVDALHRIYWIERPEASEPGEPRSWEREGERVSDWLEAGRLRRREFARAGADPASARISIDYPGTSGGVAAAGTGIGPGTGIGSGISIDNPWCGYEAVWITLEAAPTRRAPGH